jgi:hypothetical protein
MKTIDATMKQLKTRLAVLDAEHKRLTAAIRVLSHINNDGWEVGTDTQPKKRKRHFVHKTTCIRCGNPFRAKRRPGPNQKAPQSRVLFCHKPCTSNMYARDQRLKKQDPPRKVTILPGDPLKAGH